MENLKIRVENEAESKYAQELFFELGYKWNHLEGYLDLIKYPNIIRWHNTGEITQSIESDILYKECKEITLPELRDMVVLKRNDVGDATHTDPNGKESLYFRLFGDWWNLFTGGKWQQFSHKQSPRCNKLKPIEKTMKEWLNTETYEYKKAVDMGEHSKWIEIPEWAVAYADHKNGHGFFYDSFCKIASFYNIVWSRHTHPEELPFIDDEPKRKRISITISKPSPNDQYAEIEKVRQDIINSPIHYADSTIECIDAMEAMMTPEQFIGYLRGNVFKYQWRYEKKNGIEDLKKAQWYLERLTEKVAEKNAPF